MVANSDEVNVSGDGPRDRIGEAYSLLWHDPSKDPLVLQARDLLAEVIGRGTPRIREAVGGYRVRMKGEDDHP